MEYGTCVDKRTVQNVGQVSYLCDPGVWVECNEDSLDTIQAWDNYQYKCVYDEKFKWIDVSEQSGSDIVSIAVDFIKKLLYFTGFKLV